MEDFSWAEAFVVFILSATKFLFAPSAALGFGFPVWLTITITSIGGVFGISFFYFFSSFLVHFFEKRRRKKEAKLVAQGIISPRKIFTPFRRRVVRIKNKFGLIGIAFVTPCIISIPIGSILAGRFFHNPYKVMAAMVFSVLFWSLILTLLNDQVAALFRSING